MSIRTSTELRLEFARDIKMNPNINPTIIPKEPIIIVFQKALKKIHLFFKPKDF